MHDCKRTGNIRESLIKLERIVLIVFKVSFKKKLRSLHNVFIVILLPNRKFNLILKSLVSAFSMAKLWWNYYPEVLVTGYNGDTLRVHY